MNVLVDNSGYALNNLGDVAMLQVGEMRLRTVFPSAAIHVLTKSPERLARYCPEALPVQSVGIRDLTRWGYLPGRQRLWRSLGESLEAGLRRRRPELLDALARRRVRGQAPVGEGIERVLSAVEQSDILVVTGGGFITDSFRDKALTSLGLLTRVQNRRRPTALLGQGLGPLSDVTLKRAAGTALSRARLIGLREKRAGIGLLRSLRVAPDRIAVTGDDAVELAYRARPRNLADGAGVNVRSTSYSGLGGDLMRELGSAIRRIFDGIGAPLVPIPIFLGPDDSDEEAIRVAFGADGGSRPEAKADPRALIETVGSCRVVVTASYHAAVFALAQGIPALGLARSDYYADKFLGLADMFGPGCEVVVLGQADWKQRLESTVHRLWVRAEDLRENLLASAAVQIESARNAYARLGSLI